MESSLELLFAQGWLINRSPHSLDGVSFTAPPMHSWHWALAEDDSAEVNKVGCKVVWRAGFAECNRIGRDEREASESEQIEVG